MDLANVLLRLGIIQLEGLCISTLFGAEFAEIIEVYTSLFNPPCDKVESPTIDSAGLCVTDILLIESMETTTEQRKHENKNASVHYSGQRSQAGPTIECKRKILCVVFY